MPLRALNSLDSDQAQLFFGPDLGPNCLQRFSVDGTRRQRVYYVVLLEVSRFAGLYIGAGEF